MYSCSADRIQLTEAQLVVLHELLANAVGTRRSTLLFEPGNMLKKVRLRLLRQMAGSRRSGAHRLSTVSVISNNRIRIHDTRRQDARKPFPKMLEQPWARYKRSRGRTRYSSNRKRAFQVNAGRIRDAQRKRTYCAAGHGCCRVELRMFALSDSLVQELNSTSYSRLLTQESILND